MIDRWLKKYENHPAHKIAYEALVWKKIILPGWRIRVDSVEPINYQDSWINVTIWEPRKQKPSLVWKLYTDTFKVAIHFDKSQFYYL